MSACLFSSGVQEHANQSLSYSHIKICMIDLSLTNRSRDLNLISCLWVAGSKEVRCCCHCLLCLSQLSFQLTEYWPPLSPHSFGHPIIICNPPPFTSTDIFYQHYWHWLCNWEILCYLIHVDVASCKIYQIQLRYHEA